MPCLQSNLERISDGLKRHAHRLIEARRVAERQFHRRIRLKGISSLLFGTDMSERILTSARVATLILVVTSTRLMGPAEAQDERPFGLTERVPWTSSKLHGFPEPPPPFVATKTFSGVEWNRPLYIKPEPDGQHLFVIEQGGEKDKPSRIFRINDSPEAAKKTEVLAVPGRLVYGMEFHPNYSENGHIFLFSNGPTGQPERLNRVTRYTVAQNGETISCDPESAAEIISWRSMGHDGGDLVFGNDGMLYITSGDGTSDSDKWLSAQDVTNLQGGVLRIDVDHPTENQLYSIPSDNPFRAVPKARGEWWAIGLRNPWRMSVDRDTGQIWVGNNGQDLWETAHLLRKGENYGWSVYEGSHPFYAHRELGPGTLVAPTFEHHHTESRSLTGGVTYRGASLSSLNGAYVYGDYSTGKIWAGRHNGQKVVSHQEIADTPLAIVAFSNSHQGDLLVVDTSAGIYKLERNPDLDRLDELPKFPGKLSKTGLFISTKDHVASDGVIPYDVVAPGWTDGASSKRFIAVPDQLQISWSANRGWGFPDRSALVQTLSLSGRRLETRILLKQQNEWQGYSFLWNDQQSDATLVPAAGQNLTLADGSEWRIPSRAECMSCHARAVKYVLGLSDLQMNRDFDYHGTVDNQLRTLAHIGLLKGYPASRAPNGTHLVNPYQASASLEARARSYLHTNCACCHVSAGGGNARMELEFTAKPDAMRILDEFPQHAAFGLSQPRIVAPGEPDQSVMLTRISKRGRGQMPPLVTKRVDEQAVKLFRSWIESMPQGRKFVNDWKSEDFKGDLSKLHTGRSLKNGKTLFRTSGCGHCHRIEEELAGIGPNLEDIADRRKPTEILDSIVSPSRQIAPNYATTIVITTNGKVFQGRIHSETHELLVLRGLESFAPLIRIPKSGIDERLQSQASMMPNGTINHLTKEQILDLLAYVIAGKVPPE